MVTEFIQTRARTTRDGFLNPSVKAGLAETDVAVVVQVRPIAPSGEVDGNGWPKGFWFVKHSVGKFRLG